MEKRTHTRHRDQAIALGIGNHSYKADEWSYGGFLVKADPDRLPVGTLVEIICVGVNEKQMATVNIRARVIRRSDDGHHVALENLHLNNDALSALAELNGEVYQPALMGVGLKH